jgi:predicted nucleic acid-binding protein
VSYRYLIDTNLLIYPLDSRDLTRQDRAASVLLELARRGNAALPVQTLAEFSSVALRRLHPPLSPERTRLELERLTLAFPVLPLTAAVVLEALRGVSQHHLGYYDAQIWATARLYQVPLILSEDFPTGATVEGVRFINPLASEF